MTYRSKCHDNIGGRGEGFNLLIMCSCRQIMCGNTYALPVNIDLISIKSMAVNEMLPYRLAYRSYQTS